MKAHIFCENGKPYLSKDVVSSGEYVVCDQKDYFNRGDLNGFAVIERADKISPVKIPLSDFYEDETCAKPLSEMPQTRRFAYRKYIKKAQRLGYDGFGGMDREIGSEKVLILQASAERCAEILNGGGDADAFGGKRIACF
jgi:hypothetical protein